MIKMIGLNKNKERVECKIGSAEHIRFGIGLQLMTLENIMCNMDNADELLKLNHKLGDIIRSIPIKYQLGE